MRCAFMQALRNSKHEILPFSHKRWIEYYFRTLSAGCKHRGTKQNAECVERITMQTATCVDRLSYILNNWQIK